MVAHLLGCNNDEKWGHYTKMCLWMKRTDKIAWTEYINLNTSRRNSRVYNEN